MGKKRRGPRISWTGKSSTSTSLSTTQTKEIASRLSRHPQIHNSFSNHVDVWEIDRWFCCTEGRLKELGEVVAAAHEDALAHGCREAVALALCALPIHGNHVTALNVFVPRNSVSAPFLTLLADSCTCVLEKLTLCGEDWFWRKAEWPLLTHLILHNTTLKSLQFVGGLEKMSEKGGIALADSIRNNRGLQEFRFEATDAFGKEGGGLALAAMLRHNSTLRILHLDRVPLCSRGTEALAKAVGANRGLRELKFTGRKSVRVVGPRPLWECYNCRTF